MKKMLMLGVAGMVITVLALRPECPQPAVPTTAAAPTPPAAGMPEPLRVVSFATPAVASAGRNVFAFPLSMEDRRSRLSLSPAHVEAPAEGQAKEGQARVPVLHDEPSSRYLGAFGPAENPIIVVKRGTDVVNVPLRKP